MLEFIEVCFSGPNLFATLLLGAVVLYWIMVILGVVGLELLDFGLDFDVELDGDLEPTGGSSIVTVLDFFHLGEIPVMIFASFFSLLFWILTMLTNYWFNDQLSVIVMLWWLLPCAVVSLLGTKLCVMPLVPMFKTSGAPGKSRARLVGEKAVVSTSEITDRFGQIRIETIVPPVVLNARVESPPFLKKGDFVSLVRYDAENDLFFVALEKWEEQPT